MLQKVTELCGAELRNGEKCKRKAGWGVSEDQENPNGRCKDHLEGKNEDLKKEFIQELKSGVKSIKKAASNIGRAHNTVWKWRQKDEEFDRKVREAKKTQKELRSELVKDSVFKRIMNGEASASVTIFWLKNNAGWQNNPDTVVNVNQEQRQGQKSMSVMERARKIAEKQEQGGVVVKKEREKPDN